VFDVVAFNIARNIALLVVVVSIVVVILIIFHGMIFATYVVAVVFLL
jgi:hypothetical protein